MPTPLLKRNSSTTPTVCLISLKRSRSPHFPSAIGRRRLSNAPYGLSQSKVQRWLHCCFTQLCSLLCTLPRLDAAPLDRTQPTPLQLPLLSSCTFTSSPVPSLVLAHALPSSTAAVVWGSSLHLARWMLKHPETFLGRSVAELGAGTGLPSLVIPPHPIQHPWLLP